MDQVCLACFGSNLSVLNGVLVCEDCGTQCLAQVEETEYEEVGGGNVSRRRAAGSSKAVPRTLAVEKALEPDEARSRVKEQGRAYLQCLQLVLQAQADALVQTFCLVPEVRSLVRHIWLSLVPHLRCLDFELLLSDVSMASRDDAEGMELGGREQGDQEEEEDTEKGDANHSPQERMQFAITGGKQPGVALRNRAKFDKARRRLDQEHLDKILVNSVIQGAPLVRAFLAEISLQTTLSICILACIILRQPVTPFDILRWALDGQLPYLDACERCRHMLQALDPLVAAPLEILLQPSGAAPATSLLVAAIELSNMLGLEVPNVNGPLLLYKACCELALPEEVFLVAKELHDLFLQDSPLLSPLSMHAGHHPYGLLLSVTATAVWLCYGLDGGAPHFSALPPPPQSATPPLCVSQHTPARPPGPAGSLGTPDQAGAPDQARAPDHSQQRGQDTPMQGASVELWQAGLQAALPPSHAAMMQGTTEERLQLQRRQLMYRLAKQHPPPAVSKRAQLAQEAEVAMRTSSIQASGWLAWAHVRMQEHTRPHSYPASVDEACRLRGPDLASYLQYCRTVVFGGALPPSGFSDIAQFLNQVASPEVVACGYEAFEGPGAGPGLGPRAAAHVEGGAQLQGSNAAQGGAGEDMHGEEQQQEARVEEAVHAGTASNEGKVRNQPHKYTAMSSHMLSPEVHHPDLLALMAACGAMVNVHPELIFAQMHLLQQKLHEVEKCQAEMHKPG